MSLPRQSCAQNAQPCGDSVWYLYLNDFQANWMDELWISNSLRPTMITWDSQFSHFFTATSLSVFQFRNPILQYYLFKPSYLPISSKVHTWSPTHFLLAIYNSYPILIWPCRVIISHTWTSSAYIFMEKSVFPLRLSPRNNLMFWLICSVSEFYWTRINIGKDVE